MPEPTFEELIVAMKDAVGILQGAEIPFVLGGGLSAWARGGPRSEHDVDFLVRPDDVDTALAAFDKLRGLLREYGRDPNNFGLEVWVSPGTGNADDWRKQITFWT